LAVTDWRLRRWRLWFLALPNALRRFLLGGRNCQGEVGGVMTLPSRTGDDAFDGAKNHQRQRRKRQSS